MTALNEAAQVLDKHFYELMESTGNYGYVPTWDEMGEEHQQNVRNAVLRVVAWLNDNPDKWEELGLNRE